MSSGVFLETTLSVRSRSNDLRRATDAQARKSRSGRPADRLRHRRLRVVGKRISLDERVVGKRISLDERVGAHGDRPRGDTSSRGIFAATAPGRPADPAGSYTLAADRLYGVPPLDITFTIPSDGWVSWGPGVLTNEPNERDHVGIGFHNVANLYKDPCLWRTSGEAAPRVGPTVADLTAAFARQPHFTASAPTDVTVDGFRGSFMTMTIDADLDFAGCDSGQVHSWIDPDGNSRYYAGPGQVEQFWIVDVDGTRLVIEGSFFPDAPPANLTDLATDRRVDRDRAVGQPSA